VNLQRIERLKGLLARVELNAKKTRTAGLSDVMVAPGAGPIEPVDHVSLISAARSSLGSAVPVSDADLLPPSAPVAEPVAASLAAPIQAKSVEPDLEDMELDELAVELLPVEPEAALTKPTSAAFEIEDVSAEDISFEEVEQPTPEASAPLRTDVQATAMPFTAPPALDELTFSEPPPPPSEEEAPVSSRQPISAAPDSIDAALLAATEAQAEIEEPEAPLLTPPPESGRMPARLAEPPAHRVGALTVEQLGEVVELEEATGPALELAERALTAPKAEPEELEFVPQPSTATPPVVTPAVAPPAMREAMPTLVELQPQLPSELPPPPLAPAFDDEAPTSVSAAQLGAQVISRKPVTSTRPVVDVISQARTYAPASFLELLDASMKLGKH
jgi:hypothetical protein